MAKRTVYVVAASDKADLFWKSYYDRNNGNWSTLAEAAKYKTRAAAERRADNCQKHHGAGVVLEIEG